MDPRSPSGITYEKFLKAFKTNWTALEKASGRTPNVVIVGLDKAAANVRRCLEDLKLDAHVIVDVDTSPTGLLITHTDDLSLMPGTARHAEHGHILGGGKN